MKKRESERVIERQRERKRENEREREGKGEIEREREQRLMRVVFRCLFFLK